MAVLTALKIVTVLRSGGSFEPGHVERLRDQCKAHAADVPFVCLSDIRSVPGRQHLVEEWPGSWSKIEAFRVEGPVLCLDLDVTIVDDLGPILSAVCDHPFITNLGSGAVMGWSGWMGKVHRAFSFSPEDHMVRCTSFDRRGAHVFIDEAAGDRVDWSHLLPQMVVSHKDFTAGCGARIVCQSGKGAV